MSYLVLARKWRPKRFDQLVGQEHVVRALTNALAAFHLSGSNSAAIGGDLAYQYGLFGNNTNAGTLGAQNVLGNAQFGSAVQTLQTWPGLQDGLVRLS